MPTILINKYLKKAIGLCGCIFLFIAVVSSQIINIEERRKLSFDSTQWHEELQLGFNLVQNNQTIFSISGGAQLEFVFDKKMLLSVTSIEFVKAGEEEFVNEGYQHLRYNSLINKRLIFEVFGQAQYNEQAFIKLRALAGTGLRFILLKKEKSRFYAGLSYMYEYEEETQNNILHQDSRANSYLSFQLEPKDYLNLSGTMYYQPLFKEFADYRLILNASASLKITEKLRFGMSYRYLFDSRRPEGAPRRIFSLNNFLRYSI